jgi:hypothetical protein
LRLELGMPPVHVLVRELTEEVRDRLFKWSSELWEVRPLFRDPGLGTKEAGTPLATRGSNAECPLPLLSWRLRLFSWTSSSTWSSSSTALFFLSLRAFSTVSFAHGSRTSLDDEDSIDVVICSDAGERIGLLFGGAILTVTGLQTILELRAESTAFLWQPFQHTVGSTPSKEYWACWIG